MAERAVEELLRQGKWDEAITLCHERLQSQPGNPRLHAYLGLCHYRKQQWPDAEQAFRRATSLDPNFWEAGVKLAQCLDRMMRYEEAVTVAQEWLRLRPNDPALCALVEALDRYKLADIHEGWERSVRVGAEFVATIEQDQAGRRS